MKRSNPFPAVFLAASFLLTSLLAGAQGPAPRAYGKGHPFQSGELPEGKLKAGLQALDPQAKEKALKWLHEFSFGEYDAAEHLRVDQGGGVFIVCPDAHGLCEGHSHGPSAPGPAGDGAGGNVSPTPTGGITEASAVTTDPPVEKAAVPVSSPPAYSSKPGATRHIYLDFNGGIVTNTAWNNNPSYGNVASWNVKVWTQDADSTTFSDAEQTWMRRVWQRVAEDYAPFDVDVTTDVTYDPDNYTGNKDNVGWLLICETTDANGVALPHNGSGGVAYVGVFGNSNYSPTYQPAWVTSTNGGGNEAIIAEAASHEMGHNMGLSHDGTSTLAYYGGHAATTSSPSWGPIMGTGYNQNISQWSKGEYYDANQLQDDLSIMSGRIPYRADDHGDTPATATIWTNSPVNQAGIVETTSNPDCFKFTAAAGPVSFSANPFRSDADTWGGNLDILMELYDSSQVLVASSNPAATATASISTTVAAGTYYLVIKPSAAGTPLVSPPSGYTIYGSLGQYTVTGSFTVSNEPEIAVEQPVGTDLVDGSANLNFGSVNLGSSSPLTFTVKNVGTANLTGLSISKDGANSADFTVGSLGATSLAAGASTTFAVTFSPGATGPRTAAIHLASNDADENPFDITLTGTGTTPGALAVTSASGLASSGPAGGPFSPAAASYTLTNSGGSPINWTASKSQSWVSLSAASGTLAAGASTTVTVSINSGANSLVTGAYSDSVSFVNSTNGSGNTARDVALTVVGFSTLTGQNFDASSSPPADWSTNGSASWSIVTSPLTSHTPNNAFSAPVPASRITSFLVSSAIAIPADATITEIHFWHRYNLESAKDGGRVELTVDGGTTWIKIDDPGSGAAFLSGGYNGTISLPGKPGSGNDFDDTKQVWTGASANGGATFGETVVRLTDAVKYSGKSLRIRWGIATNDTTASSFWYVDSLSVQSNSSSSSPGTLAVTPAMDLNSSGSVGGPFLPASQNYTLQNTGGTSINWTAAKTAGWVTLSSGNGSLAAGASTTVTVSINSTANSLLAGSYNDLVSFTNSTNGNGNATRNVSLSVVGPGSLSVTAGDLNSSGSFGGPFTPASRQYTLQNTGTTPLNWTAAQSTSWVTLSPTSGTLDAGASTTVTVSLNTGANSLNAGNYSDTVTFTNTTNGGGNVTRNVSLAVNPQAATVTLGNLSQTYNGSAKSATATTSPAGLGVSFTYNGSATAPTNAGSYAVVGTINDPNYTGSASGTLVISKATATVTLGTLSQTYNGSAKSATATTSPTGLGVGFTYNGSATAPTNAGSYTVVATINDPNYTGSASGTLVIAKASATVTLGSLSQTYNGSAKSATATTSPAGLSVGFTYNGSATAPINAASYTVVATINDPNYTGSASGTLVISKATAVVTLGSLSQTYNGSAKSATATTSPAGLSVGFTYNGSATAPINAASYAVVGTINDPNYTGSASGTLVIAPAVATITLGNLSQTFDGTARSVTATTSPAGLSTAITYDGSATPPTHAGTYSVAATITDPNHTGSASGSLVVGKATASVNLGGLAQTYDGSAKSVSATTTPAGLLLGITYNGSTTLPVAASTYAVVATINDTDYQGSASASLVIAKATATVQLGGLSQAYDGSPKSVTATTVPAGLSLEISYNGSSTPPSAPGSYAIVASVTDANHTGSTSGTLVITNDLIVATSESFALPNTTTTYASLLNDGTLSFGAGTTNITGNATNHGLLRLSGDAVLNVAGTFTNTGVIDLINWSGTLPPGLANSGTILDRSAIRVTSTQTSATTFTLSVPGYAGHLYQLETKTDLSAAWQPLGSPVAGTGSAANPPAVLFSPTLDGPRRFFRVVVTPAP